MLSIDPDGEHRVAIARARANNSGRCRKAVAQAALYVVYVHVAVACALAVIVSGTRRIRTRCESLIVLLSFEASAWSPLQSNSTEGMRPAVHKEYLRSNVLRFRRVE